MINMCSNTHVMLPLLNRNKVHNDAAGRLCAAVACVAQNPFLDLEKKRCWDLEKKRCWDFEKKRCCGTLGRSVASSDVVDRPFLQVAEIGLCRENSCRGGGGRWSLVATDRPFLQVRVFGLVVFQKRTAHVVCHSLGNFLACWLCQTMKLCVVRAVGGLGWPPIALCCKSAFVDLRNSKLEPRTLSALLEG